MLTALLCFGLMSNALADRLVVGDFSGDSLDGWQPKSFSSETDYRLLLLDQKLVLQAMSENSASGLFKKQRIDLLQTPFINWRWRIENRLSLRDEHSKSGDDYAARVYAVVDGGLAFWRTKAINYVWAVSSPKGSVWPNAFAGNNAIMMALRANEDATGTWFNEKRNLLEDLRQHVDKNIRYIDAVAVMTDTDNGKGKVTAYYGDIYLSKD
ncbi:DUF3047 domain-containing protein [Methylicorpusculum oleiharenae]|uniref:DUF3047 domain-containing protein n=1 Tax=Methylicorpusculum oleiharenae TaxID=1338687 RepID=UPI0013585787|nr:DUF3047 domain-containing protein [Methylicorpusculum oleiharenae]MCD2449298.1 DUF3047 domain-containing protein [Methylicorpusculum oleiharenae]